MPWHYPLIDELLAGRRPVLADHPAVDRAVSVAWASAAPAGRSRLVELLLQRGEVRGEVRGSVEGLVTLIRVYDQLEEGTRDVPAGQLGRLQRPLRLAWSGAAGAAPEAVIGGLMLIERGIELHESAWRDQAAVGAGSSGVNRPAGEPAAGHVAGDQVRQERLGKMGLGEGGLGEGGVGWAGLLGQVAEQLRHREPAVRERAGRVFVRLAEPRASVGGGDAQRVTRAVGEAVMRFAVHRHPAVLRAWLALGERALADGGPAVAALQDPEHPAVGPLREMLQGGAGADPGPLAHAGPGNDSGSGADAASDQAGDAESRSGDEAAAAGMTRGLLPALAWSTLAMAAVQGLRGCCATGRLNQALRGGEALLDLPTVRQVLARAGDPADLLPAEGVAGEAEDVTGELEAQIERHVDPAVVGGSEGQDDAAMAAWIVALPMGDLAKAVRLRRLGRSGDAATRLAALRRLLPLAGGRGRGNLSGDAGRGIDGGHDPRALDQAVAALTDTALSDADPGLARLAATWLLSHPPTAAAAAQRLTASRHEPVRAAAGQRLGARSFDRVWDAWPRLDDQARLRAARAALRLDPTARLRLDAALRGPEPLRQRARHITALLSGPTHPPETRRPPLAAAAGSTHRTAPLHPASGSPREGAA